MTDDFSLERLPPETVAERAAGHLNAELKHELVKWVIRCGLGPAFVRQSADSNLSPDAIGHLLAISFDPETDPVHADLLGDVKEWGDRE